MTHGRASGILLHVTSLPSPHGIGDFGPDAYRWIDFLVRARQRYWQMLPLGPTAHHGHNSPYLSSSAFAGNPLLISPALLIEDGWIEAGDVAVPGEWPADRVDYEAVVRSRHALLYLAYEAFSTRSDTADFDAFCAAQASWLHPFAVFRAIGERHPGRVWWEWPAPYHDASAVLAAVPGELEEAVRREKFIQFLFEQQWTRLRRYAHDQGVQIFGDVAFYVDEDCADVWSRPELFKLDETGRPRVVAGVPPDAFSDTGQLWGNPVYDWAAHARDGYAWWTARMRRSFEWFDRVRLDHFRGLAAHWEVPAGSDTAIDGAWVRGPGKTLLDAVVAAVPAAGLVAEDLGIITPDVHELIDAYGFPGMKVLLFAFDSDTASNPYTPHNHERNAIVYTGTHDNNTARGWFEHDASPAMRARLADYLGRDLTAPEVSPALVRMALMSVCRVAILPMQDVLGLGADARMNRPASPNGNWEWRLEPGHQTPELANYLAAMTEAYGRT